MRAVQRDHREELDQGLSAQQIWQDLVSESGFTGSYSSVKRFVRRLAEALNESDKVTRRYLRPDLLIIDDMGLKRLPKQSGEYFFEIIMRRYELRSMIMTSNRPLEEWGKLVGDILTATAILDRFLSRAEIIQITGKSYRLKDKAVAAGRTQQRKGHDHREE